MPAKENDRLTKQEIDYFRLWSKGGAPWPGKLDPKKSDMKPAALPNAGRMRIATNGLALYFTRRETYDGVIYPEVLMSSRETRFEVMCGATLVRLIC